MPYSERVQLYEQRSLRQRRSHGHLQAPNGGASFPLSTDGIFDPGATSVIMKFLCVSARIAPASSFGPIWAWLWMGKTTTAYVAGSAVSLLAMIEKRKVPPREGFGDRDACLVPC